MHGLIDLPKVYDRVNWRFIHDILYLATFLSHIMHLVIECVTFSSFREIWNGALPD